MLPLAVNGYTAAEVVAALVAGAVVWDFRYDVLGPDGGVKGALGTVYKGGATITQDTRNALRRTLALHMAEDPLLNPLADQVRPWARLLMPDGGFAEWPLGTFLITTPPRERNGPVVSRQMAGYDRGQVLADDKVEDRVTVLAGSPVTAAVAAQLDAAGLTRVNLQPSPLTLPVARDWKVGTPRATIIADLLAMANYAPLVFDALGVAQVLAYVPLGNRPIGYRYADDAQSVLLPNAKQGLDSFAVPNVWVGVTSEADRAPLRSVYENVSPDSPTSIVSRGRRVVKVAASIDAVDQDTLDAAVFRLAEEDSQVYETVTLQTGLQPFHGDDDVIAVRDQVLGIDALYRELGWTCSLQEGAVMTHTLQRLVLLS